MAATTDMKSKAESRIGYCNFVVVGTHKATVPGCGTRLTPALYFSLSCLYMHVQICLISMYI